MCPLHLYMWGVSTNLVRVVHSEDVSFKFLGVRARITLLHHCVERFPWYSSIWMHFEEVLIAALGIQKLWLLSPKLMSKNYLNLCFCHCSVFCNKFQILTSEYLTGVSTSHFDPKHVLNHYNWNWPIQSLVSRCAGLTFLLMLMTSWSLNNQVTTEQWYWHTGPGPLWPQWLVAGANQSLHSLMRSGSAWAVAVLLLYSY